MTPSRRRFLLQGLIGSGLVGTLPKSVLGFTRWADDLLPTPPQGAGPFYPVPPIDQQKYYDADLTRLDASSPVADGEPILVRGSVVGLDDRPLSQVIVEVWQACASGRYNHPQDQGDRPIDPHFQYWARMKTSDDGQFAFRTIQPGKYPGRTPHIHYRIAPPNHPELVTQMYFESQSERNRRDEIYMDLRPDQRKAVTIAMESRAIDPANPQSESLPTGNFKIVLGPQNDSKSTRPM